MNIARIDNGYPIDGVKYTLGFLPTGLIEKIPVRWYLIDNPLFAGLLKSDIDTFDGRKYSTVGGWAAKPSHSSVSGDKPHIFLNSSGQWAAVHEFGHILDFFLDDISQALFFPEKSLTKYGTSNPSEYFACAFDAYCGGDHEGNGRNKLKEADENIWGFFDNLGYIL